MITEDNKKLAQWAMEYALKNGCQASRVNLYNGSSSSYEVRDMKIDRLHRASENNLFIQLFVDGRYGSFSTNRLDKKEIQQLIKNGISSTRFLAEDTARTLPDSSLYYRGGGVDLQLLDPNFDSINPDDKVALAMKVCDELTGKDNRIISANSSYSDELGFTYMVASNGFEGETANSYYSLNSSVSIKGEGEARPESYWYDTSIDYATLQKDGIGTKALERVLRKLGQRKVKSGTYQMVLDNMNSSRVLSPILSALDGWMIQQKSSFLIDKLNQKIGNEKLTIFDEPHMPKTPGSRYFDAEGVATKQMPVFENGVLKTYYINTYAANKLGVAPTISDPSVLTMKMSSKNVDELISSVDKGILITGFNGGNNNNTTGDFSYGIEGFLIEKGKTTQPISEMNITGNFLTLWNNLVEVGNDPRKFTSRRIPSLLFDGVDFSGL